MVTMTLEGGKELEAHLLNLEKKVAKKIVRRAVRAAAKSMLAAAKANAQTILGGAMGSIIARALQVRAFKKQRPGQYGVKVQHSEKINEQLVYITAAGQRHYIPNAIEYGHAFPGRGGGKNAPKDVPAKPYVRPAFDSTKNKAIQVIRMEVLDGIQQEWM